MSRIEAEVSGLHYYPIKSCAVTDVESSIEIGERGFKYDRHWMVVNPAVEDNRLIISASDEPSILEIPLDYTV